jgi:SAM-dependent methyltransferase
MKSFWHPISAVFLPDPTVLASPALLKLVLKGEGQTELLYAGDRMWPAIYHGDRVTVRPVAKDLEPGAVVLCDLNGVPDILRVVHLSGSSLRLCGDSSCDDPVQVGVDAVLGIVDRPSRTVSPRSRQGSRLRLNLREVFRTWDHETGGDEDDPTGTVRQKYEYQAPFYVGASSEEIESALLERVRQEIPAGGSVLVAGCGVGTECFGLAREGWKVKGLDFSETMIQHAEKQARQNGLAVSFEVGDVRICHQPVCSLDAVLFAHDVYSFIPTWKERAETLESIARWLKPGGVVFLSARRIKRTSQAMVLTTQWLSQKARGGGEWGSSHSRWIAGDASLRRAFVRYFSHSRLAFETHSCGYAMDVWDRGYTVLRRPASTVPVKFKTQISTGTVGQEC